VSVPGGEDKEGEEEPTQITKVREYIMYSIVKYTVHVSVPDGEDKGGEEEPTQITKVREYIMYSIVKVHCPCVCSWW
jgi:hypothetical protein